jgi:hypothetical protein
LWPFLALACQVNGDGVYLDNNFTPVYVGLDAATSVYVMWPKIN